MKLIKRLTLRGKKGTAANEQPKEQNTNKDNEDIANGEQECKKLKKLPPVALKVFKMSHLSEQLAVENWDVFLNCLYYTTPKKTFVRPPPMVVDKQQLPSQHQQEHRLKLQSAGPFPSTSIPSNREEQDTTSIEEFSREWLGLPSAESESETEGSSTSDDANGSSSSELDSDFDPHFLAFSSQGSRGAIPVASRSTSKPRRHKKKHYTQTELDKMVQKVNPREIYTGFHEIGKGTYGKVYIATKKGTKQKEALKHMKRDWDTDADNIANELALLDSCHHPNIVNYITSYLDKKRIWMVMEYCDAGTLKQLLVIEMSEGQIANVLKQVLKGLSYLHSLNRIHRDIKSANILLNMNGDVKVADLGLCIEGEGAQSGMAGSKYWMAPEMIKRQPYNTNVDVWSTGALAMEMAEGNPPYHLYKPLKAIFLTATKGAAPLKKPEKWSDVFKNFLRQCFVIDPGQRPSANELLSHPLINKSCDARDLIKALKLVFLMRVTQGL